MVAPEQVIESLEIWAKTMASMPSPSPKGYKSNWPDIVQSYHDAYGYTEARERYKPTPRQIDMAETVEYHWMPLIDECKIYSSPKMVKAILYLRGLGDSFYTIEGKLHKLSLCPGLKKLSYKTYARYHDDAVNYLACHIHEKNTSIMSQKSYT